MARINQPWRFLSSYGLTVALLLLLMLLTLLGTLDQTEIGLYRAQHKYFSSMLLLLYPLPWLPIPLPGAYAVFILLGVNLVTSLLVRFRWCWANFGLVVAHLGILGLLFGALLTNRYANEGFLSLVEGNPRENTAREFIDNHVSELLIVETSASTHDVVYKFPYQCLKKHSRFEHSMLPFSLEVVRWFPNLKLRNSTPADSNWLALGRPGVAVEEAEEEKEHEYNRMGAEVKVLIDGEERQRGFIASGLDSGFSVGGRRFELVLRKVRYELPFEIKLIDTNRELHPGTGMARRFESRVEVHDASDSREVLISMNQPLRHKGFTFFQSGYQQTPDGGEISTLAVVRNPGELWPYISCLVICAGVSLHFLIKLGKFAKRRKS